MRVMYRFFVLPGIVMPGSLCVMSRGLPAVFRCLPMVISSMGLAGVSFQKSHQRAFNLSKSVTQAASEEKLLQFPLLVRLDDA